MTNRQLAAIMFTDIVGYTALMGSDDKKALAILKKNRTLQKPIIEEFNGRWIKELGDGVMASFGTAADAVYAAVKIQETCNASKEFQLKIGIHLGDVLFENDDVFGDGVNIAARIQAAAAPGCIFISETVHHNISNKSEIKSQFVKEEKLKNVSQPVRMYQVLFAGSEIIEEEKLVVPTIEKSIAVLPFVNMSNDADQEFFSDGISEEIINMLAQVQELKVIGRTSSFAFKGKNMDLKVIGDQLKVSYILEGSVRKSGNKLRITAQLIKVADGFHLYSEKFDKELEDIFAIQDEVSLAILNAIKIKLLGEEKDAVLKKYTDNIDAYQFYLQGRYWFNQLSPEAFTKAIDYFQAAIQLDPNYALAYADMSYCYFDSWANFGFPKEQSLVPALAAAQKALALDDQLAESHIAVGRIKFWYEWDFAQAGIEFHKAIEISPNNVEGNNQLGAWHMLMGNYAEGHRYIEKTVNLDPFSVLILVFSAQRYQWEGDYQKMLYYGNRMKALNSPVSIFWGNMFIAWGHFGLRKYKEAIAELKPLIDVGIITNDLLGFQGVASAFNGETSKALEVIEKMKKITGAQANSNYNFAMVYASLEQWDQFNEYYQKAIELREWKVLCLKSDIRRFYPERLEDPEIQKLIQKIGLP